MSELPVIFTDLDGTLLDHDTYSAEAARSVLEKVTARGIPVIPATSKTYSEVVEFRDSMNLTHAFIVENGAACYRLPQQQLGRRTQKSVSGDET